MDSSLLLPTCTYFAYMSILWWLGLRIRNAGLVDFGWPSGFTALALYFAYYSDGLPERRWLIAGMYALCGCRFMLGWVVRNVRDGEDRRWQYWRERWQRGEGLFRTRSVPLNFFAFYHAQTFATVFILMGPLIIACQNGQPDIHFYEWLAVLLWAVSFVLENVADFQLDRFRARTESTGGVCRTGLWYYSRHPNYFFEFMIWCSYALFAASSVRSLPELSVLVLVPITAYWFLVHFTGIPMTERASLERRGAAYAEYQSSTNRFFPWFPRS